LNTQRRDTPTRPAGSTDDRLILGDYRDARCRRGFKQLADQGAEDRRAPAWQELVPTVTRRGRPRVEAGDHDQARPAGDQLCDGVVEIWKMNEIAES
jgi:hypothetical protein